MATQLQLRRDTAANLALVTPVEGEPGYDKTNKRLIVGDGLMAGGIPHASYRDIQNSLFCYAAAPDSGSTGNAILITMSPAIASYSAGQAFRFKASAANTGTTTVNINGKGAKTIKKKQGTSFVDLAANDIISGQDVMILYDGTYFQLLSGAGSATLAVVATVYTSSGTHSKDAQAKYIRAIVVGGGGGGGGYNSNSTGTANGGSGGTSSFGSWVSATGGSGGTRRIATTGNIAPVSAGTGTGGSVNLTGDRGVGSIATTQTHYMKAGNSPLGYGFGGLHDSFTPTTGATAGVGYGAGGTGGYSSGNTGGCGSGGGYSEGYFDALSIGSSETITVGAAGSAGAGGTTAGAAGSAGLVIVIEYRG